MRFDTYDIFARIVPAVLTGIPFYVLYFFLVSPVLGTFFQSLLSLKIVSDVTVAVALLYLAMHLNRFIAKELYEKRMFKNGQYLPTTCYLLHSDTAMSSELKQQVHNKIQSDFGIAIPSMHEEGEDEKRSRKLATDATSLIRTRMGKGKLIHQHNIEYGFARNLVGGSVVASLVSAVSSVLFLYNYPSATAAGISLVLFTFYALVLLFGKKIIRSHGISYCEVLIREYLAL
jgi:hypothetical protein